MVLNDQKQKNPEAQAQSKPKLDPEDCNVIDDTKTQVTSMAHCTSSIDLIFSVPELQQDRSRIRLRQVEVSHRIEDILALRTQLLHVSYEPMCHLFLRQLDSALDNLQARFQALELQLERIAHHKRVSLEHTQPAPLPPDLLEDIRFLLRQTEPELHPAVRQKLVEFLQWTKLRQRSVVSELKPASTAPSTRSFPLQSQLSTETFQFLMHLMEQQAMQIQMQQWLKFPCSGSGSSSSDACTGSTQADGWKAYDSEKQNAVIILDWDDTLFPTTWYHKQTKEEEEEDPYALDYDDEDDDDEEDEEDEDDEDLSEKFRSVLSTNKADYKAYCQALVKFLNRLESQENILRIVIVTNASKSWAQCGIRSFPRKIRQKLESIELVSARDEFKKLWKSYYSCSDGYMWKKHSFEQLIKRFQVPVRQVLSIGDGDYEREAVKWAVEKLKRERKLNPETMWKSLMLENTAVDSLEDFTFVLEKILDANYIRQVLEDNYDMDLKLRDLPVYDSPKDDSGLVVVRDNFFVDSKPIQLKLTRHPHD